MYFNKRKRRSYEIHNACLGLQNFCTNGRFSATATAWWIRSQPIDWAITCGFHLVPRGYRITDCNKPLTRRQTDCADRNNPHQGHLASSRPSMSNGLLPPPYFRGFQRPRRNRSRCLIGFPARRVGSRDSAKREADALFGSWWSSQQDKFFPPHFLWWFKIFAKFTDVSWMHAVAALLSWLDAR